MATKGKTRRQTVTEEVHTVDGSTYEVEKNIVSVEETADEEGAMPEEPDTTQEPAELSIAEVRKQSAQLALDRMLQNAMASRDQRAWEKYHGALEMANCLGYTINVTSERFHTLSGTV